MGRPLISLDTSGHFALLNRADPAGGRVLTLNRRHFGVVAREGKITPLPAGP